MMKRLFTVLIVIVLLSNVYLLPVTANTTTEELELNDLGGGEQFSVNDCTFNELVEPLNFRSALEQDEIFNGLNVEEEACPRNNALDEGTNDLIFLGEENFEEDSYDFSLNKRYYLGHSNTGRPFKE